METVFEMILPIAIIVISIIAKNKNARKKAMSKALVNMMREKAKETQQLNTPQPAEKAAAAVVNTPSVAEGVLHAAPAEEGIKKPVEAVPDHEHEGKDPSCPALNPAQHRPALRAETEQKAAPAPVQIPALNIAFDRQSVVQGVIMSEVLTRPTFKNGRRVIR